MTESKRSGRLLLLVLFACTVAACGGGSSGPTSPGGSDSGRSASFQYAGTVSIGDGTTGFLTVETTTHLAGLLRPGVFDALLDWFAPRLLAQSGTATGSLALSDGMTVAMSGTYSAGTVQMSGGAGYAVTVSVSGTTMSGTVTTPRGSGSVSPLAPVAAASVPASPVGSYAGTFNLTANGYFYNRIISTGRLERDCGMRTVMTGTLKINVLGSDSQNAGRWNVEYNENTKYTFQIGQPCPNITQFEIVANTDPNATPPRVSTSLSNLQIAFSNQLKQPDSAGTETTMFVGAMTGTTITGRLIKSRTFGGVVATNNEHWEGWPPSETTVVLQKQ